MINYLHIDCEMGGIDTKYSLLTAYFLVTNSKFEIVDSLYLYLKPDDDIYLVSGQGMNCNKIDIIKHNFVATPYKVAKALLYYFLNKNTSDGKNKLTPVGHGVKNDITHILDKLISVGSWEKFCTYHYIDTSVILQFLRACGKLPYDVDGSVSGLVNYFNIPIPDIANWHDAKFDTHMTMEIYKEMIDIIL